MRKPYQIDGAFAFLMKNSLTPLFNNHRFSISYVSNTQISHTTKHLNNETDKKLHLNQLDGCPTFGVQFKSYQLKGLFFKSIQIED